MFASFVHFKFCLFCSCLIDKQTHIEQHGGHDYINIGVAFGIAAFDVPQRIHQQDGNQYPDTVTAQVQIGILIICLVAVHQKVSRQSR
jgi:hypothetical protein